MVKTPSPSVVGHETGLPRFPYELPGVANWTTEHHHGVAIRLPSDLRLSGYRSARRLRGLDLEGLIKHRSRDAPTVYDGEDGNEPSSAA